MTPWIYQGKEFTSEQIGDSVGFVYLITNLDTDRKYIGKKLFRFRKTKQVKLKKKKISVESDWSSYYGSCKELLEDIEKIGKEKFKREILCLTSSKSEATYLEAKLQFQNKVLESNEWYNSWIMCKIRKSNLKQNKTKEIHKNDCL